MKTLLLKGKGESDYDFKEDILFLKMRGRTYAKSIELETAVIDFDEEGYVTGIQVFDASAFFGVKKTALMRIPRWEFKARIKNDKIEISMIIHLLEHNKAIEKHPVIAESIGIAMQDAESICEAE